MREEEKRKIGRADRGLPQILIGQVDVCPEGETKGDRASGTAKYLDADGGKRSARKDEGDFQRGGRGKPRPFILREALMWLECEGEARRCASERSVHGESLE